MTREEAINEIQSWTSTLLSMGEKCTDKTMIAQKMAIKALEQESCEDAVSRQAVRDGLLKYGFHAPDMTITEFVNDLPPVHPTRKRGKWVEYENGKGIECSECCVRWDFSENMTERFEFCPNCASDNREVGE